MKVWVGIVDSNEPGDQNSQEVFRTIRLEFNIQGARIEYGNGDPIQKSLLPKQKLHSLICTANYEFQMERTKESREAYLLHFEHCIVAYSTGLEGDNEEKPSIEIKKGTYLPEQVVFTEGETDDFVSALLLIKPDKNWAHIFKINYDEELDELTPLQLNLLTKHNYIKVAVDKFPKEKGVLNISTEKPVYDLNKSIKLVSNNSQIKFDDETVIYTDGDTREQFHISKLYGQEKAVVTSNRYKLVVRNNAIKIHTAFIYCKLNIEYIVDVFIDKNNPEEIV